MRGFGAVVFGLFMIAAGVAHFVNPDFYLRLMPPWLPWHEELVLLSGVCEIVAGVLENTIRNFPWPKSMRWGAGNLRWVRPLHSILTTPA